MKNLKSVLAGASLLVACALPSFAAEPIGLFTSQGDVGSVSKPGTGVYDAGAGTYTIGASGVNMWFKTDAMHFVYKEASGDLSIGAGISFVGSSTQPHRKGCLMIRQNLTPGSPYVDVARHGDGLTSLQFRLEQDGTTAEIQSMTVAPSRVRLDKIGDTVYLSVAGAAGAPQPSGASVKLAFKEPFYVGLAVTAHDDSAFETAVFSRVEVGKASPEAAVPQPDLHVITLPSGDKRVSYK